MEEFSLLKNMARQPKVCFEKIHPDAILPSKSMKEDVGWDVSSIQDVEIPAKGSVIVKIGLKLAYIDDGYWIKIESRSGLAFKHNILAFQGIIDNPYRGEIGVKLFNFSEQTYKVQKGDRVAQLVIYYENIDFSFEWGKVVPTKRQERGFGSSGK
jgi:dUTP pyrophosphatase